MGFEGEQTSEGQILQAMREEVTAVEARLEEERAAHARTRHALFTNSGPLFLCLKHLSVPSLRCIFLCTCMCVPVYMFRSVECVCVCVCVCVLEGVGGFVGIECKGERYGETE